MRLLHTSDWHLGRSLLSVALLEHQRKFIDWLVATADSERVDAIVIAGDVYDRAVPPVEAVELLEDALLRLSRLAPVILVPGNHDSPTRLGFAGPLLAAAGVHIRSSREDAHRPVLLTSGSTDVAIYGIPFLHPDLHHRDLGVERSHEAVLGTVMDRIRADLAERPDHRCIVVSHAFVTGSKESDSERDVSVGGVGDVSASIFHGVDYVALGHLHRPQSLTGPGETTVGYSGSPLAYSFSEEGQAKSVTVIDIDPDGSVAQLRIPIPAPRELATIRGNLADLLADPALESVTDFWIRAVITDPRRPADCMERLRSRFPHAIELTFSPVSDLHSGEGDVKALDLVAADPLDVACAFVQYVTDTEVTDAERLLLREAVEAVRSRQVAK